MACPPISGMDATSRRSPPPAASASFPGQIADLALPDQSLALDRIGLRDRCRKHEARLCHRTFDVPRVEEPRDVGDAQGLGGGLATRGDTADLEDRAFEPGRIGGGPEVGDAQGSTSVPTSLPGLPDRLHQVAGSAPRTPPSPWWCRSSPPRRDPRRGRQLPLESATRQAAHDIPTTGKVHAPPIRAGGAAPAASLVVDVVISSGRLPRDGPEGRTGARKYHSTHAWPPLRSR